MHPLEVSSSILTLNSLSLSSLFVSKSLHQDPPALCIFFTCLKLNHFLYSIDDNPPAYFHLST